MKRLLPFVIALLSCLLSQAQPSSNTEKLSQQDKTLLQEFISKFKEAVNHQDKMQLEGLVNFPLACSHCIADSAEQEKTHPYINVTRELFLGSQYQIFFTAFLTETVNQNDLFSQLQVEETETKQGCTYLFGYPIIKPSKTWEGLQGFFSIRKINGQYKIAAAWTVP